MKIGAYRSSAPMKAEKVKGGESTGKSNTAEKVQSIRTDTVAFSGGMNYLKGLEKQIDGTAFHIGTVSYGQTYGNAKDNNFVVDPRFLSKLETDSDAREKFEEDVRYLNDFSNTFRQQQAAAGREVVSQGWFCDENGNWGGWSITKSTDQKSFFKEFQLKNNEIIEKKAEKKAKQKKAEEKKAKKDDETEKTTEELSGKVGFNAAKRARQLAAAKTAEQVDAVLALLDEDLSDCKEGFKNGWCDEQEVRKAENMIKRAKEKRGKVTDKKATPEEEMNFLMSGL